MPRKKDMNFLVVFGVHCQTVFPGVVAMSAAIGSSVSTSEGTERVEFFPWQKSSRMSRRGCRA